MTIAATFYKHAVKHHPVDTWLFACPDDPYDPCPCGCGTKFRYVLKQGEQELEKHYQQFKRNLEANHVLDTQ